MITVRSTSIAAVGYDDRANELHVTYLGGDTYVYALVPKSVFRALLEAKSVGTFVNLRIKPTYPVRGR